MQDILANIEAKLTERTFTVRWYEQFEMTGIKAKNEQKAIAEVKNRISKGEHGEHLDTFDFVAIET